nr:hypothetical protein [uncultured archaeon]
MVKTVPKIRKEIIEKILKLLPEPHSVDISIFKHEDTKTKIAGIDYSTYDKSGRMENPTNKKLLQIIDDGSQKYKDQKIQLKEAFFYLDKLKKRKSKTEKGYTEIYGGGEISVTLTEWCVKIECRKTDLGLRNKAATLLLQLSKFPGVPVEFNF